MENPFKWRHFQPDIILLCVRWYLLYSLSYRDLEEMMTERGLSLDHTTIYRWVQRYAPELDIPADAGNFGQRGGFLWWRSDVEYGPDALEAGEAALKLCGFTYKAAHAGIG